MGADPGPRAPVRALSPAARLVRGAAAGVIAGLVASFAMDRLQAALIALSLANDDAAPATERAVDRIAVLATGQKLAASDMPLAGQAVHYALGAGLGALYGAAAEYRRDVTMGYGTVFGVGVAALLDEAVVPAAGLGDPPWRTDVGTHAYSLVSHLMFGAVTEGVRAYVRPLLA